MEISRDNDYHPRTYDLTDYIEIQNGIRTDKKYINEGISQLCSSVTKLLFTEVKGKEKLLRLMRYLLLMYMNHDYSIIADIYSVVSVLEANVDDIRNPEYAIPDKEYLNSSNDRCLKSINYILNKKKQKKTIH